MNEPTTKTVISLRRAKGHQKKRDAANRNAEARRQAAADTLSAAAVGGQALVNAVNRAMFIKGHDVDEAAKLIGVSANSLRSFARAPGRIAGFSHTLLRSFAEYTGLPVVQVMLMANVIVQEDFYVQRTLDDELATLRADMESDGNWCSLAPCHKEWRSLPRRTQLLIAQMFEQLTGVNRLSCAVVD